ncbi:OmpA family protein [Paraburkholderia sp.]|uniref:OmpA family protein n=1 Tax=Paraburkholderia sp. TaxID=1926495 RepID=UPI003D7020B0
MTKFNSHLKIFMISIAIGIAGCASNKPHEPKAAEATEAAPQLPVFPQRSSATLPEGQFVDIGNLRNMAVGLSKDQVHYLIGVPHFHEGVFGVHEWNYLLNFRHAGEVVTCQYQVKFDKKMKVEATYWQEASCADLVNPPAPPVANPKLQAEPVATTVNHVSLRSDALFAFGGASMKTVSDEGINELNDTIAQLKQVNKIGSIDIVGHTDRIGSAAASRRLSVQRANAIRDYLVKHGIDREIIHTRGVGASESVSHCPGGRSPAVIDCLKSDRRVEIFIKSIN